MVFPEIFFYNINYVDDSQIKIKKKKSFTMQNVHAR